MNEIEKTIKINGIKTGAFLGVCLLVLSIASFYFITAMAKSPVAFVAIPIIFSFLLPIALVLLFSFSQRKKIGGYWSFKQATTGIFIMFFIAYVIQISGRDLVFGKFIEPDMVTKIEASTITATTMVMQSGKSSQQQIDAKVAELKTDFDNQRNVTIAGIIQGIAVSIIFAFVLALIFGALMKRDPPVYETVN